MRLTPKQAELLWYIHDFRCAYGRAPRVKDIAARMKVKKSRASRLVTELETAGIVERGITITPAGVNLFPFPGATK